MMGWREESEEDGGSDKDYNEGDNRDKRKMVMIVKDDEKVGSDEDLGGISNVVILVVQLTR